MLGAGFFPTSNPPRCEVSILSIDLLAESRRVPQIDSPGRQVLQILFGVLDWLGLGRRELMRNWLKHRIRSSRPDKRRWAVNAGHEEAGAG